MIERRDFIRIHWNQYLTCEKAFVETLEYVDLQKNNYNTCSNRISVQLITICTLIDSTLREMYSLSGAVELKHLAQELNADSSFSPAMSVYVKPLREKPCRITPWENLAKGGKDAVPEWWNAYNGLKHDRYRNEMVGTLKNLMHGLAAFYIVEMLYAKKVGDYWFQENGQQASDETIDVPNDVSRVFELENWTTREHVFGYEAYTASQSDIDDILNA